jgi:multisubunit Na+/H+ antiporter MnhE subunit
MLGALRTLRAALAADITLSPALLRLRSRADDDSAAANLAAMISATPGSVVVGADSGSLLVHVINEGSGELADFARLETLACGERP